MVAYSNLSPMVSVIIPTFNRADYLPEAIDSVLAQTYRDFEIIVVDDGSTDDTEQVIARFGNSVRFLKQTNRGPSTARNKGIQIARGVYIAFLDSDDLFLSHKLEIQTHFLDQHPEISVVFSDGLLFWRSNFGVEETISFSESGFLDAKLGHSPACQERLILHNGFPIHAAMVRRNAITEVGGFDEELHAFEDWDLWYRVAEKHHFAYLDDKVAKYRIIRNSISRHTELMNKALEEFYSKVEISDGFCSAPATIQSEFYYQWGMLSLELGKHQRARHYLDLALKSQPEHLHASIARYLTRLFGKRAITFYNAKRRIFGVGKDSRKPFYRFDALSLP